MDGRKAYHRHYLSVGLSALDPSWSGILVDSGQTASEWNLVALESNLHHVSKEFNQQNNHDHCGWKH